MSKNLTFKLIMDGDNKGLVTAAKQSESVTKKVFDSIKAEADQLKQTSAATAIALGSIVPEKSKELADGLTKSLSGATQIIRDAGDNAKSAASNFTDFGNKSIKALAFLKSDLEKAKIRLEAFSKTKATPADIEIAQKKVDQLEKEVQQAESAFIDFHTEVGKANNSLKHTDTAAQTAQKGLNGAKFAVNALAGAMAALGVGVGIRELAQTADTYTNLSARINIATKEGGDFTSAMAGVHQVALMTNSSLSATGDLFTRLNAVGKDLGMTQQNSLDLTKTINQAIQISGVSAQASEAFTQQFIQSMQQGTLRGEEYNSMMENGYGVKEVDSQIRVLHESKTKIDSITNLVRFGGIFLAGLFVVAWNTQTSKTDTVNTQATTNAQSIQVLEKQSDQLLRTVEEIRNKLYERNMREEK